MPGIKSDGLQSVYAMLKAMQDDDAIEGVQKRAAYTGMSVVLEEVKRQINALPTQNGYLKDDELPRHTITRQEQKDLINHIGISRIEKSDGTVSVALSFEGYGTWKTKKYPKGVPIPLIARSVCSGSSVRQKQPFVRKAKTKAKNQAVEKAVEAGQELLEKIIKENNNG